MSPDRRQFILAGGATVAGLLTPDASAAQPADKAKDFIAGHEKVVKPLEIRSALTWWDANITGRDDDFKKKEDAQNAIDSVLSDKAKFADLKAIKEKGSLDDKHLARQIELLYLQYLEKQVDPDLLKKISAKSNAVEQTFNVFRAKVDGSELPDSRVRAELKDSVDSAKRKKVWEASKEVGTKVEADLRDLVRFRNEAAKQLGFKNYHALMLTLNEQNGDELVKLFDDLDALTKDPFSNAKADIDERLARKYKITPDTLMPWHYHDPFFQESPSVYEANLDAPFTGLGKDGIVKLCQDFYAGIGLPIEKVIKGSDLFEKRGKSPHAFCTDINRNGDVRVLANIVNNEYWMGTMLHELGHAVYSSVNIPDSLSYVLRAEAHILTTEGVAMQFERFSKNRAWLEKMKVKVEKPTVFDDTAAKVQRNRLLIFSRWCQVMLRFEKAMYENPEQNLNTVWWDLVEKYQQVKRPEGRNAPDYASKIHICSAPVYYHNYMMGELFASQVHHTICRELYAGAKPNTVIYVGDTKVGDFMKEKVFNPGRTMTWKELTKHATGEELNPKAFAADFQG